MNAGVIKAHLPESACKISCIKGDLLSFSRKATIYPGWIWCTDANGDQGWAPEAYVAVIGNACRFIRDYDSRELEIQVGAGVEILEQTSGWAWVCDGEGRQGWIPLDCLRILSLENDSAA